MGLRHRVHGGGVHRGTRETWRRTRAIRGDTNSSKNWGNYEGDTGEHERYGVTLNVLRRGVTTREAQAGEHERHGVTLNVARTRVTTRLLHRGSKSNKLS